jgi:hypothetical protein
VRPARSLAGVGAVVLATLVALVVGSFQGHEQPTPRPTPLAPSTTADPRQSRPLAGLPLFGPSRLRLLVASEPAPLVVDLDRQRVQPVTGLPGDGERLVSVLPVGGHAVIVSEQVCNICRPPAAGVYGIWRGHTAAVQLGRAQEVAAARDGQEFWLLGQRTATACTLREVGLDGRLRRPPRPVSCTTTLLAATGQLLLTSAEPQAPLTLTNLASHRSWRLGWPSRLRGGTHIAAVHPNGRDIAVGFHGLAAPGEEGYDLWLLHTASRRWQHLPDLPAADVAAKATDLAWTRDGRLVGAGPGTGRRGAMAPVKALQRHHHGPASRMASKPGEG